MELGFWSLVPPLLTIILALTTKNVFISLLIGIISGSFILSDFNLLAGINMGITRISEAMSPGNTLIIGSILITGAIIYLMEKSGGIEGFVNVVVRKMKLIKTKRGANLFTWVLGLAVFTSGTLSCMVTGAVSRPVNDALKVPHEKSAFIVHTTSTPWCVLFPFSGWLASMTAYLVSGGVPEGESVAMLFKSVFLNFYCILAIVMVLVLSLLQKDFGPMAKAEKRAAETGLLDDPAHGAKEAADAATSGATPRARNLLVPIGVLIVTMFTALIITGWKDASSSCTIPVLHEILRGINAITKGAGTQALIWAVCASLITIMVMTVCQKQFKVSEVIDEMFKGMGHMLPLAFVLLFGFTMGTLVKGLDTGNYLSYLFQKLLSPALLPALTFLIAMLISFATGTSMGTMAIMALISLPMAYDMGANIALVAGAMFGGSIFGDHCSPISDTTIMTCSTTGCDIIDHIKTQAPYCIFLAVISFILYVVCGFVM